MHCKVTTKITVCQEVTFFTHSNLFIGFADYQGEKNFVGNDFLWIAGVSLRY